MTENEKKPEAKVSRPRKSMVPRALSDAAAAPIDGLGDEPWRARRKKPAKKKAR